MPPHDPKRSHLLMLATAAAGLSALLLIAASLLDTDPAHALARFTLSHRLGLLGIISLLLTAACFREILVGQVCNLTMKAGQVKNLTYESSLAYFLTPLILFFFTLSLADGAPPWVRGLLRIASFLGYAVVFHLLDEGRFRVGSLLGGVVLFTFLACKLFEPTPASRIDFAWLSVIVLLAIVALVALPLWFAWSLFRERTRFGPFVNLLTAGLLGTAVAQAAVLIWAWSHGWDKVSLLENDKPMIDVALREVVPTVWRVTAGLHGVMCAVLTVWSGFLLWRNERLASIIASRPHELARNQT